MGKCWGVRVAHVMRKAMNELGGGGREGGRAWGAPTPCWPVGLGPMVCVCVSDEVQPRYPPPRLSS